jgi:serine/threonine protein kinase
MHKKSGVVVALKIVPVEDDLDDIIKEINVLKGCDSPAIVRYYGSFFKNDHLWVSRSSIYPFAFRVCVKLIYTYECVCV